MVDYQKAWGQVIPLFPVGFSDNKFHDEQCSNYLETPEGYPGPELGDSLVTAEIGWARSLGSGSGRGLWQLPCYSLNKKKCDEME